jgi:pyruvate formate lyase activating enzyme
LAIIFNIQRFSVQDGPGIRTTVFFKGCPLRCTWCSNPESQKSFPEVGISSSLCNSCGHCVEVCDTQSISINDKVSINRKTCKSCGKCVEVCAPKALKFYGTEMTVDEVLQEVVRDKPFYENSGGGMTASGGEALSQPDFLAELFKRCQDAYIHTCLDTSGYANADAWEKILPYTNLILFDLKLMDPSAHKRVTGKSNRKILQSLELVDKSGVSIIIRIPIITGINDSEENITGIAQYIKQFDNIKEVNLLPYHRFGEGKYAMLDRSYSLYDLQPPDHDKLEKLIAICKSFGFDCEIVI